MSSALARVFVVPFLLLLSLNAETIEKSLPIRYAHPNPKQNVANFQYFTPLSHKDFHTIGATSYIETFTITTPGTYSLVESIGFAGRNNVTTAGGSCAIYINSSDVVLDLNNQTLYNDSGATTASHQKGIDIAHNLHNISIKNGNIAGFQDRGIYARSGSSAIRFQNITLSECTKIGIHLAGGINTAATDTRTINDCSIDNVIVSKTIGSIATTTGQLDTSFATAGTYTQDFGKELEGSYAIKIQSDGKSIIGGFAGNTDPPPGDSAFWKVQRLNTDGTLDTTFGSGGTYSTGLNQSLGDYSKVEAIQIQSDGKIVIGGVWNGALWQVQRLDTDGTLDATFGTGGTYTSSLSSGGLGSGIKALTIQSDGKIIIGGSWGWKVERLNSNGTLDTGFGNTNPTTNGLYTGAGIGLIFPSIEAIALQSDEKIIITGYDDVTTNWRIQRLDTDGTLDATFGSSGNYTDDLGGNDAIYGMDIQSNDIIVVGGTNGKVQKLSADGVLDTTFGISGTYTSNLTTIYALKIQSDGKILVAGLGSSNWQVERIHANGTIDTSFAAAGNYTVDLGGTDETRAMEIQTNGKVLLAGYGSNDWKAQRLNIDTAGAIGLKLEHCRNIFVNNSVFQSANAATLSTNQDSFGALLSTCSHVRFFNCDASSNYGDNAYGFYITGTSTGSVLSINSSGCSFINCTANNNYANGTNTQEAAGFICDAVNSCLWKDCLSNGNYGAQTSYGFKFQEARYCKAIECQALNNKAGTSGSGIEHGARGFYSGAGTLREGTGNIWQNCIAMGQQADSTDTDVMCIGFELSGEKYSIIRSCQASNNGENDDTPWGMGINLDTNCIDCVIDNCKIMHNKSETANHGIGIRDTNNATCTTLITNCFFYNNGEDDDTQNVHLNYSSGALSLTATINQTIVGSINATLQPYSNVTMSTTA
jgi:uncharacterized delta-60 repeat protein